MATEAPGAISIRLDEVSKRFGRQWVIRSLSINFASGRAYGIRGRNGSGKSTLVRILAGQLSPSRGQVTFAEDGKRIGPEEIYRKVSWIGPYLEIVEELTVEEFLSFHFSLKPLRPGLGISDILARIDLDRFASRPLTDCSSGMRQRVLLATGLYGLAPILLLDEPTLTLDVPAAEWFAEELKVFGAGKLVVIASNDERDLAGCTSVLTLA